MKSPNISLLILLALFMLTICNCERCCEKTKETLCDIFKESDGNFLVKNYKSEDLLGECYCAYDDNAASKCRNYDIFPKEKKPSSITIASIGDKTSMAVGTAFVECQNGYQYEYKNGLGTSFKFCLLPFRHQGECEIDYDISDSKYNIKLKNSEPKNIDFLVQDSTLELKSDIKGTINAYTKRNVLVPIRYGVEHVAIHCGSNFLDLHLPDTLNHRCSGKFGSYWSAYICSHWTVIKYFLLSPVVICLIYLFVYLTYEKFRFLYHPLSLPVTLLTYISWRLWIFLPICKQCGHIDWCIWHRHSEFCACGLDPSEDHIEKVCWFIHREKSVGSSRITIFKTLNRSFLNDTWTKTTFCVLVFLILTLLSPKALAVEITEVGNVINGQYVPDEKVKNGTFQSASTCVKSCISDSYCNHYFISGSSCDKSVCDCDYEKTSSGYLRIRESYDKMNGIYAVTDYHCANNSQQCIREVVRKCKVLGDNVSPSMILLGTSCSAFGKKYNIIYNNRVEEYPRQEMIKPVDREIILKEYKRNPSGMSIKCVEKCVVHPSCQEFQLLDDTFCTSEKKCSCEISIKHESSGSIIPCSVIIDEKYNVETSSVTLPLSDNRCRNHTKPLSYLKEACGYKGQVALSSLYDFYVNQICPFNSINTVMKAEPLIISAGNLVPVSYDIGEKNLNKHEKIANALYNKWTNKEDIDYEILKRQTLDLNKYKIVDLESDFTSPMFYSFPKPKGIQGLYSSNSLLSQVTIPDTVMSKDELSKSILFESKPFNILFPESTFPTKKSLSRLAFYSTYDTDNESKFNLRIQALTGYATIFELHSKVESKIPLDIIMYVQSITSTWKTKFLYRTCASKDIEGESHDKCFGGCDSCYASMSKPKGAYVSFCKEDVMRWGCESAGCILKGGSLCGYCRTIPDPINCHDVHEVTQIDLIAAICLDNGNGPYCTNLKSNEIQEQEKFSATFLSELSHQSVSIGDRISIENGRIYKGKINDIGSKNDQFGLPQWNSKLIPLEGDSNSVADWDYKCHPWSDKEVNISECYKSTYHFKKDLEVVKDAHLYNSLIYEIVPGLSGYIDIQLTLPLFKAIHLLNDAKISITSKPCAGCFSCLLGYSCHISVTSDTEGVADISCLGTSLKNDQITLQEGLSVSLINGVSNNKIKKDKCQVSFNNKVISSFEIDLSFLNESNTIITKKLKFAEIFHDVQNSLGWWHALDFIGIPFNSISSFFYSPILFWIFKAIVCSIIVVVIMYVVTKAIFILQCIRSVTKAMPDLVKHTYKVADSDIKERRNSRKKKKDALTAAETESLKSSIGSFKDVMV